MLKRRMLSVILVLTMLLPVAYAAQPAQDGMRGVWVATVANIDYPSCQGLTADELKSEADTILDNIAAMGLNTVFFQVRPSADALYQSDIFPWSCYVSGTAGQAPDQDFDVLSYWVEAAHSRGLQLHAWLNPYRITRSGQEELDALPETSPARQHPEWVVEYDGNYYFNPGLPAVQQLVVDGAAEIVRNYDVDGIQFDDYFYPTQDASFDQAAYQAYADEASQSGTPLSLQEWRIANINALISEVYRRVKAVNPDAQFGIAPQGNLQNDWNMGADVASWCKAKGFLDYICPQLYVNFENPTLPFGTAAQTWKNLVRDPDIELYFGLAVYKAGSDADDGTWKTADDILARQVSLGRTVECDGFMFYSWDYLETEQTKAEVENVMKVLNQESVSREGDS